MKALFDTLHPGDRDWELAQAIDPTRLPEHIAIIMDGNGRWAKQRKLPRIEGHRRGVEAVRTITFAARDLGVRMLTLYAFSVENWNRPGDEVGGLMGLLEYYLKRELATFVRDRVRFRTIGRPEGMPAGVRRLLAETEEATRSFADYTLVLALNYGSRTEVVDAARSYAAAVAAGRRSQNAPATMATARNAALTQIRRLDMPVSLAKGTRLHNCHSADMW